MTSEKQILKDMARQRHQALVLRIADTVRRTVRIVPMNVETADLVHECRIEMTDDTARVLAPLARAVALLEAIIFASDGCQGHAHCAHSMEPWKQARELLEGAVGA